MMHLEQVRSLRAKLSEHYDPILDAEYATAFEALEPDDGAMLAREALALLDTKDKHAVGQGKNELLRLACLVPGAMRDVHLELVNRDILYPGVLYLGAGDAARDNLIARISDPHKRFESGQASLTANHLLMCLAWIGDDGVCALFDRWRRAGMAFKGLHIPPWEYARVAGWELDSTGGRRSLISECAYALVPRDEAAMLNPPVQVVMPHEDACGWCDRQLTTLFELDLLDPRVASVSALPGERLRVAMCDRCTCFGTTYTDVDGDGTSCWSTSNVRPSYLPDDDPAANYERPPARRLILGESRRTPYGTHLFVRGAR